MIDPKKVGVNGRDLKLYQERVPPLFYNTLGWNLKKTYRGWRLMLACFYTCYCVVFLRDFSAL